MKTNPGEIIISYLLYTHILSRSFLRSPSSLSTELAFTMEIHCALSKTAVFCAHVSIPPFLASTTKSTTSFKHVSERLQDSRSGFWIMPWRRSNYARDGFLTAHCYDKIVFKKVRALFGGNLCYILIGSAVITRDMIEFMKISLFCPIVDG